MALLFRIGAARTSRFRGVIAAVFAASVLLTGCDMFVSVDRRVERAEEHLTKGQFRPAMADLKTALEQEPNHMRARVALAKLSLWLGDLDSAEKEISRAKDAGVDAATIQALQYELLLEQGKHEELMALLQQDASLPVERRAFFEARTALATGDTEAAERAVKRGLSAAPANAALLVESARIEVAKGDIDVALSLPDKVRESREEYANALLLRGAVQMNQGDYASARQSLEDAQAAGSRSRVPLQLRIAIMRTEADLAVKDAASAERSLARVANWAPQSYVTHYLRARIAMAKDDFTNAASEAQRALRVAPTHVQSQLLLASAHVAQGSLEQAQDVLTRLLAAQPDSTAARKLLAQVYLARKEPEEAQRVLAASGTTPDGDMDWLMGAALLRSGEVDSGVEHLERSVAAAPNDASRKLDLASAYIGAKAPDKAIALLNSIPKESPEASQAKVLLVLASAAGKPQAHAIREVDQLAMRHSDDAALLSAAGGYLANARDGSGARKHLQRAIELEPKRVDARIALARLATAERNLDEARSQLQQVIAIDASNQVARLGLSEIAWSAGDRATARKQLEDAVTADPAAIDARLRLAQLAFIEGDGARARSLLDQTVHAAKDKKSALTATGRVLARAGLSDEALARYKEAAAAGDPSANLHAARLHLDLGDLGKARESAQMAARGAGGEEAEQLLIMIDARDGRVDRAFDRAKRLAKNPSPAALDVLKGDLHAIAGETEAAIAAYESAQRREASAQVAIKMFNVRRLAKQAAPERTLKDWLARSPRDTGVRRMLAMYYESIGNTDAAQTEYETLLAAQALDPVTLNNFAWLLHEKSDPRALNLAKQAHEAAPQHPEIADTYGWILVRMDNIPSGLPVLKSALANAPANPEIKFHVAYAYAKSGMGSDAASLLNQALASKAPFPSRSEAEELLRSLAQTKS